MHTVQLPWVNKLTNGNWLPLNTVNLDHEVYNTNGVYLIWHGGTPRAAAHTVYVGQGDLHGRLEAHRGDPRIQAYAPLGLYISTAEATTSNRDGLEVFLANTWHPLGGERHPAAVPIGCNSPFE